MKSNSYYFAISYQLAKQQYRQSLKLCQPEEIVIIQVRGERIFSESRLERRRQSDHRKQGVKCVKRVEKMRKKVRKDALHTVYISRRYAFTLFYCEGFLFT